MIFRKTSIAAAGRYEKSKVGRWLRLRPRMQDQRDHGSGIGPCSRFQRQAVIFTHASRLTSHASRLTPHVLALPAPAYAGSKRSRFRHRSVQPFPTAGSNLHSHLTPHTSHLTHASRLTPHVLALPAPAYAGSKRARFRHRSVQPFLTVGSNLHSQLTIHNSQLTTHISHQLALSLRT